MTPPTTSPAGSERPRLAPTGRRHVADPIFKLVAIACATSVLVLLTAMIVRTTIEAWPVFADQGVIGFITGDLWDPGQSRSEVTGTYGAWPFLYGTLKASAIGVLFAVPLAIGIALFINEIAPAWLKRPLTYGVEMLAMVPSVVYALVGIYFFRIEIWRPIGQFVADSPLGVIPLFSGPVTNSSYWAAGNILAIMILPIITAIVRETFAQTPVDERLAAYAMGATRWEVMRQVIVPRGFPGIVGGTMLGLGRALGETIAVAFLIGASQRRDGSIFFAGDAVTSLIFNTFQDARPEGVWALLAIGVTLFVITMIVNVVARLIVYRVGRTVGDAAV